MKGLRFISTYELAKKALAARNREEYEMYAAEIVRRAAGQLDTVVPPGQERLHATMCFGPCEKCGDYAPELSTP